MKKRKSKYANASIGKIRIIDDFLPPPKNIVLKEEKTKSTRVLTKSSSMRET